MENTYRTQIRATLAKHGYIGMNPAHVEAFMRDEHGTLDDLSAEQFKVAVLIGAEYVQADPSLAVRLADCMGIN